MLWFEDGVPGGFWAGAHFVGKLGRPSLLRRNVRECSARYDEVAVRLKALEDKYEVLERIGGGGMGTVHKVRHRLLDELRVIKVLRSHLVGSEEYRERFLREARIAIQLRHPNIATLYDFSIDDEGTA